MNPRTQELQTLSSEYPELPNPNSLNLEMLDVSDPRLNEFDAWPVFFKRLRKEDPVHYHARSKFGPFWSITRYQDVKAVDGNWKEFDSRAGIFIADEAPDMKLETFLHLPEPEHMQQRGSVQVVAAPRSLAAFEGLIRKRIRTRLDGLPVGETFDWVEQVSVPITLGMLVTLLDFPEEEKDQLLYWTEIASGTEELTGQSSVSDDERRAGMQACTERFMKLWYERSAEIESGTRGPDNFDLLTLLITNESTKDMIDRPMEFLSNLLLLIVGGNDTTRNTMSASVLGLNQFPSEYDKLAADHSLINGMVAETLRWHSPFAYMRRTALVDVELGGKLISKGDKVVMWYHSANRDESVFENSDDFRIDRENAKHHLAFGYGIHRCMGARLAELQLRILWEEILERFERVELAGEVKRTRNNIVRGIESLPVRVVPRREPVKG